MVLKQGAKVAVIGSGVSGLSFAHFLSKLRPDVQLTVFEASSRVGGYIHSQRTNIDGVDGTVVLEKGPRTLRGASDGTVLIIDMLMKLGKSGQINVIKNDSPANKKYLLSQEDKLVQVPNDFQSFRKFIQSPLGKGLIPGFLKEVFVKSSPQHDESVHSFLSRRFGQALPDNVLSAVFHGIYAADITQLSAKSTLKAMFDAEQTHGSIVKWMTREMLNKKPKELSPLLRDYESQFSTELTDLSKELKKYPMITFTNGLSTFPNTLYDSLSESPNVAFKLRTPLESITTSGSNVMLNGTESFDHVHTTINGSLFSSILPKSSQTSLTASKLKSTSILLINLFISKDIMKYHGFGYLIPRSNANLKNILGVIFDSEVEKGATSLFDTTLERPSDYTKLTIMCGGHHHDTHGYGDIDVATQDCIHEVEHHLGISLKDSYVEFAYVKDCLPQFHVGYDDLKQKFHKELNEEFHGLISSGGMSFGDGCGVPDCVSLAFKRARNLT